MSRQKVTASLILRISIDLSIYCKQLCYFWPKQIKITELRDIVLFSGGVWSSCPSSIIWLCWWHSPCQENYVLGKIQVVSTLRAKLPKANTITYVLKSWCYLAPKLWNLLPNTHRAIRTFKTLQNNIKKILSGPFNLTYYFLLFYWLYIVYTIYNFHLNFLQ